MTQPETQDKPSGKNRGNIRLSALLEKKLLVYTAAAGAASAGVVSAQPAEAKIVYTPTHTTIFPHQTVPLDLNHDGNADFFFKDTLSTTSVGFFHSGRLSILPQGSNEIWGHKNIIGLHYASALAAGIKIAASGKFSSGSRSLAYGIQSGGSVNCEGKWSNISNRYLGLKFTIGGRIHFGWARVSVSCNAPRVGAILTGYAYETISNKPIITGQTHEFDEVGSLDQLNAAMIGVPRTVADHLGLLAAGAPGLASWRREEKAFE